jgi:hypothetical protein
LFTVRAFLHWLEFLPESLGVGEKVTTAAGWPAWRDRAATGDLKRAEVELADTALVGYPADGMAYVFATVLLSDRDEPDQAMKSTADDAEVVTLLLEDDEWRIHSVGRMVSPSELGKIAYSW